MMNFGVILTCLFFLLVSKSTIIINLTFQIQKSYFHLENKLNSCRMF